MSEEIKVSKNLIDSTLDTLTEEILEMIRLTIESFEDSVSALSTTDNKKAMSVVYKDGDINRMEEQINYKVMISLAKYQPMAVDLRRLISAIKISTDVERIADYAKQIARTAIINNDKTFMTETFVHNVEKMSNLVVDMLRESAEIIKKLDVNAAYKLSASNKNSELDTLLNETISSNPFELVKEDNVSSFVELMGVVRSLERARDHIKNILEAVIFVGNGTFVEL